MHGSNEPQVQTQPQTRKETEVWNACQTLWEEGVTIEQMTGLVIADRLQQLGYRRGSNTDIHRFKKTWVVAKQVGQLPEEPIKTANQLSSPIAIAVAKVETELSKQLKEKQTQIEQNAQEQIEHYQQLAQRATQGLEANQALLNDLQEQNRQLSVSNERFLEQLQTEREERASAVSKLEKLESYAHAYRKDNELHIQELLFAHQQTVDSLHDRMKTQSEQYSQRLAEANANYETQNKAHKTEIARTNNLLDELRHARIANEKHLMEAVNDKQQLAGEKQVMVDENSQLKEAKFSLESENQRLQSLLDEKEQQVKRLQAQLDGKGAEHAELCDLLVQQQVKLASCEEKMQGLQEKFMVWQAESGSAESEV